MADVSGGDRKLRVFISYSRKDEDFAQEHWPGWSLPSILGLSSRVEKGK
jgi:hypothetical protein